MTTVARRLRRGVYLSSTFGETPRVGIVVSIVEGLNLFALFAFAHVTGIAHLEETRGELDEPFWVDGAHLSHVLLGGEHELVVDDPVWLTLEEGGRRVDVRRGLLDDGFVSFLWVFFRAVEEESRTNGFAHLVVVAPGARRSEAVPVHDCQELLSHVLRALERTSL